VVALDGKMGVDERGLARHPEIAEMRDLTEEDETEIEAEKLDLNYISLEGNIGCLVNGAGLAMATMDVIKLHGGQPANFLDVGGGANKEMVAGAFKILLANEDVKAILINIFGGILKVDVLAQGIVDAAKEVDLNIPLVVRLEGTNVEKGREILQNSDVDMITAANMTEAADKVVAAANG
jgi:succinyl-CoA synthetase beta subunit